MPEEPPKPIRSLDKPKKRYEPFVPTEEQRQVFLSTLATCGSVAASARTAIAITDEDTFIDRNTILRRWNTYINSDPEFANMVNEAQLAALGELEAEAYKRALQGTKRGIYYRGEEIATEDVYDNNLTLSVLRKLETGTWVSTQKSVSNTTTTVKHEHTINVDELSSEDLQALKQILEPGEDARLLGESAGEDD